MLLAACGGRGLSTLGSGQPGIDVAQAALRGGSPQIALQIAGNILATSPNSDPALIIQGEALTALGRLDEAATSFSTVLQHDPASVGAHVGLGRVRLASDPSGAEALFLEALQREPRNAVALNDLGIARDLQGRHGDAQAAYRQALAANPDMSAAQVNLALSLAMSGQSRDAVQLLRPMASDPGASRQLRHNLAAVLTMAGDKAEAERILSADLTPGEVLQALEAYAAARPNAVAASMLTPSDVPVPAPAAVAAPAPAVEPAAQRGSALVQLAAVPTEHAAQAEWQRLRKQMPDELRGHRPTIARSERDGRTYWQLRTDGFADVSQAAAFCERVRATGHDCMALR